MVMQTGGPSNSTFWQAGKWETTCHTARGHKHKSNRSLQHFWFQPDDKDKSDEVLKKFDEHCLSKTN